jgi:hypothetical protein
MKILFLFLIGLIVVHACEPPRECTDPKCGSSSIFVNLKATLSDTNKVLHIGDTLKMTVRIPDTLATNEGTLYVGSIQEASIGLDYARVDTIINDSTFRISNESFLIRKGQSASGSNKFIDFGNNFRDLELHFVLTKKGHFYIQVSPQSMRLSITEKDGKKYLIMFNTGFNVKDSHLDLYLSWVGSVADRAKIKARITDYVNAGFGWYSFKVE